jgi:hypothetical protein
LPRLFQIEASCATGDFGENWVALFPQFRASPSGLVRDEGEEIVRMDLQRMLEAGEGIAAAHT